MTSMVVFGTNFGAIHSSLAEEQSKSLEHCQAVALCVILRDDMKHMNRLCYLPVWKNFSQKGFQMFGL